MGTRCPPKDGFAAPHAATPADARRCSGAGARWVPVGMGTEPLAAADAAVALEELLRVLVVERGGNGGVREVTVAKRKEKKRKRDVGAVCACLCLIGAVGKGCLLRLRHAARRTESERRHVPRVVFEETAYARSSCTGVVCSPALEPQTRREGASQSDASLYSRTAMSASNASNADRA